MVSGWASGPNARGGVKQPSLLRVLSVPHPRSAHEKAAYRHRSKVGGFQGPFQGNSQRCHEAPYPRVGGGLALVFFLGRRAVLATSLCQSILSPTLRRFYNILKTP